MSNRAKRGTPPWLRPGDPIAYKATGRFIRPGPIGDVLFLALIGADLLAFLVAVLTRRQWGPFRAFADDDDLVS